MPHPTKEEEQEARKKILIIDNISQPSLFSDSRKIIQEFRKYCKAEKKEDKIKVCAAFGLARGGVSIYFEKSEDRDKALSKLPKESFGGGIKKILSPIKKRSIYLKQIDTAVKETIIAESIERATGEKVECVRLLSRTTGKPRKVVRVSCRSEAADKILESQIFVGESKIIAEPPRYQNIIRCYKCQKFGHIAINCTREASCRLCSKAFCDSSSCNERVCTNCGGGHPASDTKCPVFIKQNENITS